MKNNIGLVEHCKKALSEGWGYVYGTFGNILTHDLLRYKYIQYPANIHPYIDFIEQNYIGKRVTDCVGLIKSYMWWDGSNPVYDSTTDKSANGMFEASVVKGTIDTIPEVSGILVWRKGHIGVYIGNGKVIESKGTKYGVVQTPLKGLNSNKWTHWCMCPYIEYITEMMDMVFKDLIVNGNRHWAADIIEKAAKEGIVKGIKQPDGSYVFKPDSPITRAEAIVLIMRALGKAE